MLVPVVYSFISSGGRKDANLTDVIRFFPCAVTVSQKPFFETDYWKLQSSVLNLLR